VLCAAGHGRVHGDFSLSPFKVVFLHVDSFATTVSACLYESESGVWGSIILKSMPAAFGFIRPSILAGNALGWLSQRGTILEYDIENQRLGVIESPEKHQDAGCFRFQLLRTQENGLGLAVLTGSIIIEIWARKVNFDGTAGLVLQKTVELHELLVLGSSALTMYGFDEDDSAIILSLGIDVFMVNINSLRVRIFGSFLDTRYPYRNFCSSGNTPYVHVFASADLYYL
jgi:hypothetical protein